MNKLLILMMLQLGVISLNAQNFKFGKVSREELQEGINSLDSTANATILYRKVDVKYEYNSNDGFVQQKSIHERIKIYNKDGDKWATKRIRLLARSSGNKEKVLGLKGYTYNFFEGNIGKEKLKSDGVFEEKKNDYWRYTSFTMPNVNPGSVIEYKYTIESPYIGIDDINFQELIPIRKFVMSIKIPEYFRFNKTLNPQASYVPKLEETKINRVVNIDTKERTSSRNGAFMKTEFSSSKWNFKENVIAANLGNIPALINEKFIGNLNNYRAKLILEYASYKGGDGQIKNYATDWDAVTKTIYEHEFFGRQLSKTNYFKEEVDLLLQPNLTNKNKVVKVLEYIKSKVNWNGLHGVYSDRGVKKAYKEGVGNIADINLMLTAVLRYVGVDANPVLISTKANGIPLYPTKRGFNYVICGVEIDNEVLLLDASDKNTTINIVPEKVLNWQGRIIRPHGSSSWVNLFPKKNSVTTTMLSVNLNEDLTFNGKLRSKKTDYFAYSYRNKYIDIANEDLIKSISKNKGEIEISNLEVKNKKNIFKHILQSYEFTYEDGVEEIGNEVYVNPLLFLTDGENIFNQEKRKYNIDFNFPWTNKTMVSLSIPEGYRVKSFPKSEKIVMVENLGEYSYLVRVNGNSIQISQTLKINFPIIPASYYEGLRDTYKKMITKNAEKIVLEKI